jgi:hypothetical protein
MLTIVLGAPGSGKSTVTPVLRASLPRHVVLDWDAFMPAAEALAGRDIRTAPDLWNAYGQLVRSVVVALHPLPTVLLGVCTPDELADWPAARWVLLDCDDAERRRRLDGRSARDVDDAVADGREYRRLGLPAVDTSSRTVETVAVELASFVEGG